jgi:hypothetical protein
MVFPLVSSPETAMRSQEAKRWPMRDNLANPHGDLTDFSNSRENLAVSHVGGHRQSLSAANTVRAFQAQLLTKQAFLLNLGSGRFALQRYPPWCRQRE